MNNFKFQCPDIPTALTQNEAHELYKLAKGRRVIEFGSLLGFSTIVLAQSADLVVSVDPHDGYPAKNPRPTFNAFRHHLKTYGVDDKVIPIVSTGQKIWPLMRGAFDLAFIDMDSIVDDLLPQVYDRVPRVCVHDYGHNEWRGATEAVDKFIANRGGRNNLFFKTVDSLAILGVA